MCSAYGLTPDPWQQTVLDDWLGRSGVRWSSLTCGLAVPRQNGKNGIVEMREVFGMVGRGEKILHTAHEVKTAQKAFRRLKHFFGSSANDPAANFPELNALVEVVRNVNGQEAIILRNGGSVEVVARSKNSGRGFTVDTLIFDEAQEMSDDDLEALLPTTSAAPQGDPQWIYTGTPPGPSADGEVFRHKRSEGLSGKARRFCWHEWSADPDVDLDDRRSWYLVNPAMGRRLSIEVAEGERSNLADSGFARERLGVWDDVASRRVIPEDAWGAVADTGSAPASRMVLAVDVDPDQTRASVALGGLRADGLAHVELYEQRSGTGWLAPWIADKAAAHKLAAVVIDAKCPATLLVDELRRRRVRNIVVTSTDDMAAACGGLFEAVTEQTMRHTGQPQLSAALAVAGKRPLAGRWAWNRKTTASDITPLVAATLALWGVRTAKVRTPSTSGPRRIY